MNFLGFDFSDSLCAELSAMEESRRIPHAVIVTGGSDDSRRELVRFLSMWSVCTSHSSPCGECPQCIKCSGKNHIDVYYAKGTGKTDSISVDEVRRITADTAILPNEARRKVYVMYDADRRMGAEALNALLKTLEEPPQDMLFLLTAENPKALPETIRSRCVTLTMESDSIISEESLALAREILEGIVETGELRLLKACWVLYSRQKALQVLPVVRLLLSDALAVSVCAQAIYDPQTASLLRRRLTKDKIIRLIDATSDAINKVNRNVNLTLLSTWICGEYRRISWQK